MKTFLKNRKIQLKILGALGIGTFILGVFFYFLIPEVLNYPKGTYGTSFQKELENTNYLSQVVLITIAIYFISVILILIETRFLNTCNKIIKNPSKYSEKETNKIKGKLLKTPFRILLINIIVPSICLTLIHSYTIKHFGITTIKLFALTMSGMTFYLVFLYIYTTSLFKGVIETLPYYSLTNIKKTTFSSRILKNIMTLIIASLCFTALIGYSILAKQKGNSIHEKYHSVLTILLKDEEFKNTQELIDSLKDVSLANNDFAFIKDSDGKFYNLKNEEIFFSDFFNKYLNELSSKNDGRVFEYYGRDAAATTYVTYIDGKPIHAGIYYNVIENKTIIVLGYVILVLFIINLVVIFWFSKSISSELNTINSSFKKIVSNKSQYSDKLKVTASDEIGELESLYNNIQELNKTNIDIIHDNQETLMERERLASLGQLISGIAHNLKTPIMSISGTTKKIEDLAIEYSKSIEDSDVTVEDHKEIANEILDSTSKIYNYTSYMSDIITTVKGQAVQLSTTENDYFTISELLKRVNILLKHELKQSLTYLNISMEVDENTKIKGDVNSFVQVLNNIISNAIQAYGNTPNNIIDLKVSKKEFLEFRVRDYGPMIPKHVQDKLFKEMITTKGKNGTGLGLYMSYSTIKANFNGTIKLISNENYTEFTVYIPYKEKK